MSKITCIFLFLLMTLLGAGGSALLKSSLSGGFSVLSLLRSPCFYMGGTLYFGSALLNILLLRYMHFAILLSLTSVTYVWSLLLAKLFFKESITILKICGLITIFAGVFLLLYPGS